MRKRGRSPVLNINFPKTGSNLGRNSFTVYPKNINHKILAIPY
jgi:hypothetical protein